MTPKNHDLTMETLIHKTVLPDGLTVITERIPGVRSVSIGIWIKAGSQTDSLKNMGMAHFIEHMFFKGTEKRSVFEIAYVLESLGGSLNAFTTRDLTCYYACVLDEHIVQAVDVLSDILTHSVCAAEEIEREKKVVMEEIRSSFDIPEELALDTFTDNVLNPHPESKPILGILDTVTGFQRSQIYDYVSSHYCAPHIVIAAAGNIEHQFLVELVTRYFQFNNSQSTGVVQNSVKKIDSYINIKKKISQAHICYGGKIFGYTDTRRMSLSVLNTILGNGMSSRLFQNIREKYGLTYSIYSFTELLLSVGVIATYAATDVKNIKKTLKLIDEEYDRLKNEIIDEKSIYYAKSQLKGNLVLSLESSLNRMSWHAKNEIYLNTYYEIDDTIHQIDEVTPEQVQKVAQEIFDKANIYALIVSP